MTDISRLLEPLISDSAHLIISVDFNFRFKNHDDPDRNKFCELLSNLNMCQLVCEPTHRSGHILDLVITRANRNSINEVSLGCQMGSGHFCERKWHTSRLEIDKQIHHDARKTYFANIDAAKTNYHRAKISEASPQKLFSLVDNLIGGKKLLASTKPT